jgi:hypothetical protein
MTIYHNVCNGPCFWSRAFYRLDPKGSHATSRMHLGLDDLDFFVIHGLKGCRNGERPEVFHFGSLDILRLELKSGIFSWEELSWEDVIIDVNDDCNWISKVR